MDAISAGKRPRRGFTLVEILVVIVIIGLLAALLTPAIIAAMNRAKVAAIKLDLSQLDMAITEYKQKNGDYPPDFAGLQSSLAPADRDDNLVQATQTAILRHLRRAFPRYVPIGADPDNPAPSAWDRFREDVQLGTGGTANGSGVDGGLDPANLTPASAIVFWLGGLPDPNPNSKRLLGFSANPRNPFDPTAPPLPKLFEFSEPRLRRFTDFQPASQDDDALPWLVYTPSRREAPYVYFRARDEDYPGSQYVYTPPSGETAEIVRPYYKVSTPGGPLDEGWVSPDTYQIISAALDDRFGATSTTDGQPVAEDTAGEDAPHFPSGDNFKSSTDYPEFLGHHDNVTNFSEGTLEDEMP